MKLTVNKHFHAAADDDSVDACVLQSQLAMKTMEWEHCEAWKDDGIYSTMMDADGAN